MFLLNSCLSLFSAAHSRGRPLSRSYGVILPSSLTVLLPSALGFSPHPPVSVYGTGLHHTIAAFLATGSKRFATLVRSASQPCVDHRFFQMVRSSSSDDVRCWNLNQLSIGYAVKPRLRSRLTQGRSALPWKPQIFGLEDSHLHLATHSGILSSCMSTVPFGTASALHQCSSTNVFTFLSFGIVFQPR